MARNIAIQYDSVEVTKNEIILTMKKRSNFLENRLYIDKIESLAYARTMNPLGLIFGALFLITGIVSAAMLNIIVGVVIIVFGIVIAVLAILSARVRLSIGIGGRFESITFKRGEKSKIKELYNQILQVMEERAKVNAPAAKVHTAAPENMQEMPSAKNE
ncbi:MAG TPA: hypothetical protein H9677_02120 [Firmicutes bacterium]|nr:hypothetical protein [Bacillota bacterium]